MFRFLLDPEARVQYAGFCSAQDQPFVVLSTEPGRLQSRTERQGGPCSGKSPLLGGQDCAYPRREKEEVSWAGVISAYAPAPRLSEPGNSSQDHSA